MRVFWAPNSSKSMIVTVLHMRTETFSQTMKSFRQGIRFLRETYVGFGQNGNSREPLKVLISVKSLKTSTQGITDFGNGLLVT